MLRVLFLSAVLTLAAAQAQDRPPPPLPTGMPDMPARAVPGTHNCQNYYPTLSAHLFESGRVQLRYDVTADGSLVNVVLDVPSGSERLDTAALACLRERWKDLPATRNSVPVASAGLRAIVVFASPPPTTADDFKTRGDAYMEIKKPRLAIDDYTQSIALNPNDARIYWSRSDAFMVLGDTGRAIADRAKAGKITSTPPPDAATAGDAPPWVADQKLGADSWRLFDASGILAIKERRDDLEAALARARSAIDAAGASRPTRFALTDGPAQTLLGLMLGAADKENPPTKSVAIANPYPRIAMLLGSYYNEIGQPNDALRVLDAGLAADKIIGIPGEMAPALAIERCNALNTLKRFDESLAGYDEALKAYDLKSDVKAHLLRGRGYALTELNRLDDAEASYKDSLAIEPGNETARNELRYIAQLRAGMPPQTSGALKPLQPRAAPATPAAADPKSSI